MDWGTIFITWFILDTLIFFTGYAAEKADEKKQKQKENGAKNNE